MLQGGEPAFQWPDFNVFGLKCSPSFGFGPIYRGRLDRPSILVVADQQSQDDLFTMRALTGDDGQHLQSFLRAAGITGRYAILRVLPVDTLADDQTAVAAAVDSPPVRALYAEAVGVPDHRCCCSSARSPNVWRTHVTPAGDTGRDDEVAIAERRRRQLASRADDAVGLTYRRDITSPTFTYAGEREQIPVRICRSARCAGRRRAATAARRPSTAGHRRSTTARSRCRRGRRRSTPTAVSVRSRRGPDPAEPVMPSG